LLTQIDPKRLHDAKLQSLSLQSVAPSQSSSIALLQFDSKDEPSEHGQTPSVQRWPDEPHVTPAQSKSAQSNWPSQSVSSPSSQSVSRSLHPQIPLTHGAPPEHWLDDEQPVHWPRSRLQVVGGRHPLET
jgi:hypothetical protein